jgi:hypothetical protein
VNAAARLLTKARAAGITVVLDPPDRLKLRGDPVAVATWTPRLRPHKAELLAMLATPRRLWRITEPSGETWVSSFCPPQPLAIVQIWYPNATVEPARDDG